MCECNTTDNSSAYCKECVPVFADRNKRTLESLLYESEYLKGLVSIRAVDAYIKSLHDVCEDYEEKLKMASCKEFWSLCLDCNLHNKCDRYALHRRIIDGIKD